MARVIAVATQKGGVGKTTTALNLASILAEQYRVLAVDCDAQANLTDGFGVNPDSLERSLSDVLEGTCDVAQIACAPNASYPNLILLPANLDLAALDTRLSGSVGRELRLRRALAPLVDALDFIVIDCAPALGILTLNALAACTEVIVPVDVGVWSLKGINKLLLTIAEVRTINSDIGSVRAVLNRVDHTNLSTDVRGEVERAFGDDLFRTSIRRSVRVGEAQAANLPVALYRPNEPVVDDYRNLAAEVIGHGH
jgi:chromosome partitioning protein